MANAAAPSYSDKSRVAAGVLGVVLGGIGVHRFYLGSTKIGVIQIIVTVVTLSIGGIWGFIEGVIILAGADWKDGKGLPLKKYGS